MCYRSVGDEYYTEMGQIMTWKHAIVCAALRCFRKSQVRRTRVHSKVYLSQVDLPGGPCDIDAVFKRLTLL